MLQAPKPDAFKNHFLWFFIYDARCSVMDILSLRVLLKPLLSRAVLLGTKKEEHNLKASFVAEAAKGGDFDSCDGVRRCGRN